MVFFFFLVFFVVVVFVKGRCMQVEHVQNVQITITSWPCIVDVMSMDVLSGQMSWLKESDTCPSVCHNKITSLAQMALCVHSSVI